MTLDDLDRCSKDITYFVEKYCIQTKYHIQPPDGENWLSSEAVMLDNNNEKQRTWLNCSITDKYVNLGKNRQSGRTFTMLSRAIWQSLFNNNNNVLFIGATHTLSQDSFSKCVDLINSIQASAIKNVSKFKIEFNNGSRILFMSSNSVNSIKGMSLNLLLLDNTSLFKDIAQLRNVAYPSTYLCGSVMESE